MPPESSERNLIVVVEVGAAWPSFVQECRAGYLMPGARTHLVVQHDDESTAAFAERVLLRVDSLGAEDCIETAVLACSDRADPSACTARRQLGNALLALMAKRRRGRLVLTTLARSGGRLRQALSALATELGQSWELSGVSVNVRFGKAHDAERRVVA